MAKTLEEKIEERKQQARDRNIIGKAGAVAEELGIPLKYETDDAKEEGYYYHGDLIEVSRKEITAYPTHGFSGRSFIHTRVQYKWKRGFECRFESEDDEIKTYIPGRWERELNLLAKPLNLIGPSKLSKSEEELEEKAAKFGLKY